MMLRRCALGLLFLSIWLLSSCRSATPQERLVPVTVEVPVIQTVVVRETQEVERTVVVTATPVPTPAYRSTLVTASGTLAYPLLSEPKTLDPQQTGDEVSDMVIQQLYEGLFKLRSDGSIAPAGAGEQQVSEDGLTYTVTLRSGLTWSDGEPVTAQHFVDGICRVLDPLVGNAYYYLLTEVAGITGARDYASGDLADCAAVGVSAPDVSTLVIELDSPVAFFPQLLATKLFLPTRLDLLSADGAPTPAGGDRPVEESVVSNGPFVLVEWKRGEVLILERNPLYWDSAAVEIARIEFPILPEVTEQMTRFLAGKLAVAGFPAEQTVRIQEDPALSAELQVLVQPGTSYLGLNTQAGPTANVDFRRAIASAIDRAALIADVLKQPWHLPARGIVPPGVLGYQGEDSALGIPFDLGAAQEYLTKAGYGPENPPPAIDLWFNQEGNNPLLFSAIAEMLERAGIPVRLVSGRWNVYLDSLNACNKPNHAAAVRTPGECTYSVYRMGWVLDYADASSILAVVFSQRSALQYTGWASAEFEEQLALAAVEQDEQLRLTLYQQAEKLLVNDETAVIPLLYYDRTLLIKSGLTWDYPPFGAPHLRDWRLP